MDETEILFMFDRTNDAIGAEVALMDGGYPVKVMNLPSSIKAGCGICLRLEPTVAAEALALLRESGLPPAGLYERRPGAGGSRYAPWDERQDAKRAQGESNEQ